MKSKIYTFIIFTLLTLKLTAQDDHNADVIFRETFGSGTTTKSLPSGRTTYSYNKSSSLNDGDYRLSNTSQGRPEWQSSSDHTGDKNGRMMVINASYTPGLFYSDEVSSLNPGTLYEVYMYVMNANTLGTCGSTAILPKIKIVVEYASADNSYQPIADYSSDNIPQSAKATWVRIGGSFQMPAASSKIRFAIYNNAPGGCGNDLAIDDITVAKLAQAVTLPVKGLSLAVDGSSTFVNVRFSTLAEYNTQVFRVQRSSDAANWQTIAEVAAKGTADMGARYQATDGTYTGGRVYYRIEEIDQDGSRIYSSILSFERNADKGGFSIFPNPVKDEVSVRFSSSNPATVRIKLYNQQGNLLRTQNASIQQGVNQIQVAGLANLPAGIYLLTATDETGKISYQQKMIKK